MAIGTLSVVSWAEQAHTLALARTMGVVVFSMFNLFFSLESRDRRDSVFSLSTFADRTCIVTTGASLFLLVMATVLTPCQAILKTTALDVDQWLLCAAVALSIVAVTEIRKAFLRQTVGPVRLRRSPLRRLRHRCRAPARPGSRGLPRGAQRDPADWRHQRKELTADQLDDWLDERAEEQSRRVLKLPTKAVQALCQHHTRQAAKRLAAGEMWQEHDLVFRREEGTPLDRWHARKEFQKIAKAAWLGGARTPRELRHSFVSILSTHDVRVRRVAIVMIIGC